ncbi:MAG: HAMP domain-containing sensor histidine kinase, partial [Candidatus Paceibacterota bacterium]
KEKNPSLSRFIVVKLNYGASAIPASSTVIASLDPKEVGREQQDEFVNKVADEQIGVLRNRSVFFPMEINGERHFVLIRGIADSSERVVAYFVNDFSMKWVDDIVSGNVMKSYLFLIFIIIGIFILLIRQVRSADYSVLYKRLKEIDSMKDNFISMAAHELRTPLVVIRGYASMLKEMPALDDKNKENLRRIDISVQQLNTLIGDILDVSRLEQGRMNFTFEDIDVGKAVRESTDSFHAVAADKKLSLSCETEEGLPHVSADQDRMRQIMTNLIGNSIKYTVAGGITVKAYFDSAKEKVMIRVSDTGIGISSEEQKRLFEKFYRIRDDDTENIQGTGLGLWITKQIINTMNGEIFVESIKGKGTDFIVSFPIANRKNPKS